MDKSMREILRYAAVLFIIAAVSAALLAGVNMLTENKIAENSILEEQRALHEVMPEAESFEPLGEELSDRYGANEIYTAKAADGTTAGFCVKLSQRGYGGEIQSIIGLTEGGIVTGVQVISHSETAGLGANLSKESFRDQFVGKSRVGVVKAGAGEGEINAISGATITSKAMASSVNAAVDIVKNFTSEGGAVNE